MKIKKELGQNVQKENKLYGESDFLTKDDAKLINSWVDQEYSSKELNLLYKGSKDGFLSKNFNSYCDGKGSTLTVIKTDSGVIFGGFNYHS